MFYLDRNGAYCHIAATEYFPIGNYSILTYYELQHMRHLSKLVLSSGKQICGLVLVRILCPSGMKFPILPYRSFKSKRVSLPCCRTCANLSLCIYVKCSHSKRFDFHLNIAPTLSYNKYIFITVRDLGSVSTLQLKYFMPVN